jgi:hypothetical protein
MNKNTKNNIILYENKNGKVELRADVAKDTLWASLDQISQLFGRDKSVVSRHLKNIFESKELDKKATVAKNATVQIEGGREIIRRIEYYNLDVILSVGYRVSSMKATKFRIWATSILREYLVNGFNLNQNKLVASNVRLENLHKAIDFIESKSDKPLKVKIRVSLSKDLI